MLARLFPHHAVKRRIFLAVCTIHLVVLGIALWSAASPVAKNRHKPLVVKTIVPHSVVTTVSTLPQRGVGSTAGPLPPLPRPAESPVPPQRKKEPAVADKTVSTKKQSLKKSQGAEGRGKISDSLMRELEERIAQIEEKKGGAHPHKRSSSPTPIQLQIDTPLKGQEGDARNAYAGVLIQTLHQTLHLPEYGEVKIQLTLRHDGTVAKWVVLSTESQKNRTYLEAQLSRFQFPPLEAGSPESECTFVLAFCNEM